MIFLIRHGERADAVTSEHSKVLLEYDPPLSSLGELQSVMTADYLNSLEKEIIIVSSPFLRCLQTAKIIKSKLSKVYNNCIYIEESLGEILHPAWFDENVIEKLEINRGNLNLYGLNKETFINGFLQHGVISKKNPIKR
jgi:broad specificity phosphatase PhoE